MRPGWDNAVDVEFVDVPSTRIAPTRTAVGRLERAPTSPLDGLTLNEKLLAIGLALATKVAVERATKSRKK